MNPTLSHHDKILYLPWYPRIKVGHIVVATIEGKKMVKRVEEISDRGYWLIGDNRKYSSDSRDYGWIPKSNIHGRVVYRYAPPDKTGWLFSA